MSNGSKRHLSLNPMSEFDQSSSYIDQFKTSEPGLFSKSGIFHVPPFFLWVFRLMIFSILENWTLLQRTRTCKDKNDSQKAKKSKKRTRNDSHARNAKINKVETTPNRFPISAEKPGSTNLNG